MKPNQFKTDFQPLLLECQPKSIGEIGTHNGRTASQMCRFILSSYNYDITYTGYDAFDTISPEQSEYEEINGKGLGKEEQARRWLAKVCKEFPNRLEYTLVKGMTTDTLKPIKFDFVYIDAGHSYESVLWDYQNVKESKMIVFDDAWMDSVKQFLKDHIEPNYEIQYGKDRDIAIIRNY